MRFILAERIVLLFVITATRCATINITTSGTYDELVECNSNITFICKTPSNTGTMTWRLNGAELASCNVGYCSLDPSASSRFRFDYNISGGEFNISVQPATNNELNASFACNVGSTTTIKVINVTGDYSIHPDIVEISNLNKTNVTVSTGCISDQTTVFFQWKMMHTHNASDIRELPDSLHAVNSLEDCMSDSFCGGTDKIKKRSTLTITEDENNPDSYYLIANVSYENLKRHNRFIQLTGRTFKIRDNDVSGTKKTLTTGEIVAIVVGIIAFVVLIVIVLIYVLKKKKKSEGLGNDTKK